MPSTVAPGTHTRQEIFSQPAVWDAALSRLGIWAEDLARFFAAGRYARVYFTGCGSPYYMALSAAALVQERLGLPARGLPASEIWLSPATALAGSGRALLVALSRSGETSETLQACSAFRAHCDGEILTVGCYPGRSLERHGDFNLILPEAQEESVAQTRAFSTLYLTTVALTVLWQGGAGWDELVRLPAAGRHLLDQYATQAQTWGEDLSIERFYFLGSGLRYGLASELSLKMKEMTISHSEPFHFLEFRHGPRAMATAGSCVVGLRSERLGVQEEAVLAEMRAQGARTLTLAETGGDVSLASGVSETLSAVLYLPFGQLMALERALAKGLNPDSPENLVAYVTLPGA